MTERFDLVVHTTTDDEWQFQRTTDTGTPMVPSAAQAQIRNRANGELWASLTIAINGTTGIITVRAPRALTSGTAWDRRIEGAWDLVAAYGSDRIRLVEGRVSIDPEVTAWA